MKADDELCFCFHVTWRKVINFARQRSVKLPSQLAECYGAGTGCGWCRRQMVRLLDDLQNDPPSGIDLDTWLAQRTPTAKLHASGRETYLAEKDPPSS